MLHANVSVFSSSSSFFLGGGGGEEGGEGESVFKTYRNVRGQAFLESLTSNILMLIFKKQQHLTATSCDPIVISRFLCFNECRLQICFLLLFLRCINYFVK